MLDDGDISPPGRHRIAPSGGVTIYVAASDLMPEVNREPGGKMAMVVLLGVAVFFCWTAFVH